MYGVNKYEAVGVEQYLQAVQISNIPDREGQFLRNELIDRFYRNGRPSQIAFILEIAPIQESRVDLDITKTSDTTRGQLRLNSSMSLKDLRTGETVLNRSLVSIASYNILGNEFSTRVSEQNTRENALNDLARQIEQQLALYFKRME